MSGVTEKHSVAQPRRGTDGGLSIKHVERESRMARRHLDFKYQEFVRPPWGHSVWASLCFADLNSSLKTFRALTAAWTRAALTSSGENRPVDPGKRSASLSTLQSSLPSNKGLLLWYWQLNASSPLAKPSLPSTKSYKGIPQLNSEFTPSSPLAWNNTVINLLVLWNMLFLYWLIKRDFPVCFWLVTLL